MKKLLFLPLLWVSLTSCTPNAPTGTVSAEAQTLPEIQLPPRVMDRQVRLGPDGFLEELKAAVKPAAEGKSAGVPVWVPLTGKNFPTRVLGTDKTPQQRPLTSFSAVSDKLWVLTTPFEGYVSNDQGASWSNVVQRDKIANQTALLTCLAASPVKLGLMAAGTSFYGLYLTFDGKTWTSLPDFDVPYTYGYGYREQINTAAFSRQWPDVLYASTGKDGSTIWRYNVKTGVTDSLSFPGGGYLAVPQSLAVHAEGDQEILEVRTAKAWWRWEAPANGSLEGKWLKLEDRTDVPVWDEAKKKRMEASKDRSCYYLSAYNASASNIESRLDFMAKHGLNSLVVDFKNDEGEVMYDTAVPLAKAVGAVKPAFDVEALVKAVHARGFTLIARVVVFKDKKLYKYNKNQYALWDKDSDRPWGNIVDVTQDDGTVTPVQKEFWVDTYSQDVWTYNTSIAKELQDKGLDEIQFDYIRFPSDGPVGRIQHRFKVEGMSRLDALESFLKGARAALTIPLGVDIYGFNGYFDTDYLGQNMSMMSKYVDVISPMFYPSHFPKPFLPDLAYLDRAEVIYHDGSDRTFLNTAGRVHVRPWVQAFLLFGERSFDDEKIAAYLDRQLQGVDKSKASGFLLWNSSNKYYMVTKNLASFRTATTLPY